MVEVGRDLLHPFVLTTVDDAGVLFDHRQVVCRHDDGRSLGSDVEEQFDDRVRCLGVEIACRLVGEDQLRTVEDSPCDGNTLLLTTGELEGHTVALVGHIHSLQHLCDTLADAVVLLPARGFQHELEVLVHRTVGQQLEVLEHHTHLPSEGRNLLLTDGQQVVTQHRCLVSLVHLQLTVERTHQRGLTGTHTADKIDELSFVHLEVHVLQHTDAVSLVDIRVLITDQHPL